MVKVILLILNFLQNYVFIGLFATFAALLGKINILFGTSYASFFSA